MIHCDDYLVHTISHTGRVMIAIKYVNISNLSIVFCEELLRLLTHIPLPLECTVHPDPTPYVRVDPDVLAAMPGLTAESTCWQPCGPRRVHSRRYRPIRNPLKSKQVRIPATRLRQLLLALSPQQTRGDHSLIILAWCVVVIVVVKLCCCGWWSWLWSWS